MHWIEDSSMQKGKNGGWRVEELWGSEDEGTSRSGIIQSLAGVSIKHVFPGVGGTALPWMLVESAEVHGEGARKAQAQESRGIRVCWGRGRCEAGSEEKETWVLARDQGWPCSHLLGLLEGLLVL